jgi:hypothetical protein
MAELSTMDRTQIGELVERVVADAERSLGRAAAAQLLHRRTAEAIWDWWRETPGIPTRLARRVLSETCRKIERRTAARQSAVPAPIGEAA